MTLLDLGIDFQSDKEIIVPAYGKPSAKICFVGEAPGKDEVRNLRPFIGRSGMLLKKLMFQSNLTSNHVYMTNVVKIQLKGNDITPFFGKQGFTERGRKWLSILENELKSLSCNVVVAFGNTALAALTGKTSITKWRGSILESTLIPGLKVIPAIHPSSALRKYIDRYFISHDLRRVINESAFPEIRRPVRNHITNPKPTEALKWLEDIYQEALVTTQLVCLDIEITGTLEMSCIGFSVVPSEAMCIPVAQYSMEDELLVIRKCSQIISDERITIVGQNVVFDLDFLLKRYNIISQGLIQDTMIAQGVLFPDFPKGLDFLCSVYTNEPYYKDEGKEWRVVKDWKKFWEYNCKDAATTLEIWQVLEPKLKAEGYWQTYRMDMDKHYSIFFMMLKGMRTNSAAILETKTQIEIEIKDTQIELDKSIEPYITSKTSKQVDSHSGQLGLLNVNSPAQLKQYFYSDLGIKPYLNKGKPTCDDKALQRLAKGTSSRPGRPEAKLIQSLIKNKKFRGTYLGMKFDNDNRFRCSYRPRGTIFGRLSSAKTIFHTGMNMQNIPYNFKGFLYPDDGYWLLEIDKVQAEWVATAYLSGDRNMISVCESGEDSHLATAFLITKIKKEIIKAEHKLLAHATDPDDIMRLRKEFAEGNPLAYEEYKEAKFIPRVMSIRQCGKKSNHGFNYGMRSNKFALINEVPEAEARMIYDSYHRAYPGLKQWYEKIKYQLNQDRTLTNPFGRKVRLLDAWGESLFMQAYSFLPQSTVADITVLGMQGVYEAERSNTALWHAELLGNIHDSIIIQYPKSQGFDALVDCLNQIRSIMEPNIHWNGREFTIKTDAKIGISWGDMKDLDLYSGDCNLKQELIKIENYYENNSR